MPANRPPGRLAHKRNTHEYFLRRPRGPALADQQLDHRATPELPSVSFSKESPRRCRIFRRDMPSGTRRIEVIAPEIVRRDISFPANKRRQVWFARATQKAGPDASATN